MTHAGYYKQECFERLVRSSVGKTEINKNEVFLEIP